MVNFTEFAKSIQYKNVYSQFGEDGILEAIFEKIGVSNAWCVECGAADGIFFSNTRKLIEEGWNSVQIEGDLKQFEKLAVMYVGWNQGTIYTINKYVTDFEEIFDSLSGEKLPKDFDLLVIDVDGQDYHLFNRLLNYQPRVVICEYDPNEDVDFIPTIGGNGQAGEKAIHHVALARGYQVVCKTWCNLVCVRNDLCHLLGEDVNPSRHPLDSLGAMIPVREGSETPAPENSGLLWGGFTEQDFINAKARREQDGRYMFAASMSTPRFGPLSTMDVIQTALTAWSVPFFRTEGAYWHHHITDAIERGLKVHPDAILTFDYDSLFCPAPSENDIAKLIMHMLENPDIDVIAPLQLQREGGALIAAGDEEITTDRALLPVWFAHFGMTLFRAGVFERIAKPWFWEKPDPNGGWGEGRIDPDTGFWLNCKESGIKVCIAMDVVLGHGEYGPTYPDDKFKPIKMSLNEWRKNGQKPPESAFNWTRFVESAAAGTNPIAKANFEG
jgi:hypothetical protein